MMNDVQKPQGGVLRSGRSNGIIPTSFRSLSGYLRTVSSGASHVASQVRSASASVASSIADRIEDGSSDQVQWAGFDKMECEGNAIRQVLLLGYRSGFQVWDVEEGNNVRELVSRHDGPVSFLQMLPKPIGSTTLDKFADVRSLLVVVTSVSGSGSGNIQDGNGTVTNVTAPGNGNCSPSVVKFYSLKSQAYVHVQRFRSAVYSVRCSSRVIAISQAAQIHCFSAATLEREYTLLTYPLVSNCLGSGGIGCGPLAVGPRWLAYSGNPVAVSNTGRVTPTSAASLSGSPANGSLVAHYAKESSKHLAAGIVTLGDIGYKKLSRYYSDGNNSLKSGSTGWKTTNNGYLPDAENAGMVIVRDIVCKTVITQFRAHRNPISALHFDPSGTLLVTASVQGHAINVFRIMPSLAGSSSGSDSNESHIHIYKLQRGFTNAVIQDISFSQDSHWIMISSSRGTSHLFAINPAGGTVLPPSIDDCITSSNNGLGVTSKLAVQWPPNSGPINFNQQSLCASGPPVTLSAVSRIRNGNSGWRGTVSGAAAAATGRIGTCSGATASVFHNCKGNGIYTDANSLKTKYHLLVFSPSGSVIQYMLRPSSVVDRETVLSGSTVFYDSSPDSDGRFVVEALQKWDICQKRSRRERDDSSDVYGEYGNGDSNKIYPEEIRNTNRNYSGGPGKNKITSEERHHMYISEAELHMHQARMPLWAKPEIYFQTMRMEELETETGDSGGEIEIERLPFRVIEARSKDLVPVYDHLKAHKLQLSRFPSFDGNRSLSVQKSGSFGDEKLSCRSSCSSLVSSSEGATVGELQNGIDENGWGGLETHLAEGFVNNNGSPKVKTREECVNNTERPKTETNLEFVNNNTESLKKDTHFNNEENELD